MVKKQYQKNLDVVKSIIGSYIWMWNTFKTEILVWYCENRTAHTVSQYITSVCGINTVAILPNKDVFFGEIESDVLGMIFSEKALKQLRNPNLPKIIQPVIESYLYSQKKYDLGPFKLVNPQLSLNQKLINKLNKKLVKTASKDKFGYEFISFGFKGRNSYFKFLHTKHIQNFEKTKYKVSCLEELYVFLQAFREIAEKKKVRYCEIFVSAYEPEHQKIVCNAGLSPRGYTPCWRYKKKKNQFEDYIVFNSFKEKIEHIYLLQEGLELFDNLGLVNHLM